MSSDGRQTARSSDGALTATAVAVVGVAVGAFVYGAVRTTSIAVNHGCAYGDGISYCAMARGHEGYLPFAHRPLLPLVVRVLHFGSLPARFRLVDLVSMAVIAWLTALLTRRLAAARGVAGRARTAGGAFAGALVLLSPEVMHITFWNPVGTDQAALALGLTWLVLATSPSPPRRWWAAPAAAAAVLTREAWALPIMAGAVATLALTPRATRQVVAQLVVTVGAAGVAMTRPGIPYDPDIARTVRIMIRIHFGSGGRGFADLVWALLFTVGVLPALLWTRSSPGDAAARDRSRPLIDVLAVVAVIHLLEAVVGGATASRLALPVVPLLLSVVVAWSLDGRFEAPRLALAALGTVLVWQPFFVLTGSQDRYFRYCCPQFSGGAASRLGSTVLMLLPIVATLALLTVAGGRAAPVHELQ